MDYRLLAKSYLIGIGIVVGLGGFIYLANLYKWILNAFGVFIGLTLISLFVYMILENIE